MISAIVPTLKGQARLERNLPSVVRSLESVGEPWEIVVVDDGASGISWSGPGVRVLSQSPNQGYGPAINAGVAAAQGDYLLILNDDVRLESETVSKLRRFFPDPDLFAVAPAIRSPLAASGDEGGKAARFEAGLIEIQEAPSAATQPTLFAVGCCYL